MLKHVAFTVVLVVTTSAAMAQEWGDLDGQFIYKGTPPVPKAIVPDKDQAVCGKHKLVVEQVVVDKDSKGISGIAVYLFTTPSQKVKIHPDYQKPPTEAVFVDNKNCRFEPHRAIRTGQSSPLATAARSVTTQKAEFFNNTPFNDDPPAARSRRRSCRRVGAR
jgi:hypothetical protein